MDTRAEQDIVDIFKKVAKTIQKLGVKTFIDILESIDPEMTTATDKEKLVCDYIIAEVCRQFKVTIDNMKKPKVSSTAYEARLVCIIQIKTHLHYRHKTIAKIFERKNHVVVSHALREFQQLDDNIKTHRDLLSRYKLVNNRVEQYKEKMYADVNSES